ncbi:hypothetical protein ERHA54_43520 [Erwinia rhapontici]|uniref:Secreted protein n=1 Tax=Erwinia rhapontici TaxID=55212 RepID=A0ABM7N5I6_ERWRD|nr:hypothetical protein EDF84_102403 [Erwinia rhapontici]BCQ36747.1 hypothetical protein ERHA53_40900 [Erwinia rhapontici]BCQ41749.1 hypothetical protein ERHA54_43520 [Erwinia rhapontici]BCQ47063.1 hypothetical protein ERHA55_45900 [Erwinia rhapontici]
MLSFLFSAWYFVISFTSISVIIDMFFPVYIPLPAFIKQVTLFFCDSHLNLTVFVHVSTFLRHQSGVICLFPFQCGKSRSTQKGNVEVIYSHR